MNVKLITKALHTLSLLSEEDVATVMNLRTLSEDERTLLITVLEPDRPTTKKPAKQERKIEHCTVDGCGLTRRAAVHKDTRADGYHEFQAPQKASSKSSTKTARASGMAAAIKGSIEAGRQAVKESNDDDECCIRELENKDGSLTVCGLLADDNIHHLRTHSHYHEFTTGKSAAPPVGGRLSANGGVMSSIASSATETEDVSTAHHVASGD